MISYSIKYSLKTNLPVMIANFIEETYLQMLFLKASILATFASTRLQNVSDFVVFQLDIMPKT